MMPLRSIRIESNGKATGTHIFDSETGEEIHGISKVTWWVEAGKAARAELTFVATRVEVVGELVGESDNVERT